MVSLGAKRSGDLFGLTARLVDIPSVSHHEAAVADFVEEYLRALGDVLEVVRVGDNVLARTRLGRSERLVLAGHLDTVPPNGNERAREEDGALYGIGAADMKGGDAVMLELAASVAASSTTGPAVDITWLFYVCEEVDRRHSGLLQIEAEAPDWVVGDAAVLGEPTGARVEAGCQGVLRVGVTVRGERAHTARPWRGENAVHGLAPVLSAVAAYEGRRPVIDGCEYRESLQAVSVEGGVANNVVPDLARVVLNHRFAPDRGAEEAFTALRRLLPDSAEVVLEDAAPGALPSLSHRLLSSLVQASGHPPRAKLGWTDVAFFSERGVPAANFGPGDPELAHNAGECVRREELDGVLSVLERLVA